MTKDQAYINIKCEVAEHGMVTKEAIRFYCESHLSKKEFNNAVNVGKSAFDKRINEIGKNTLDISLHGSSKGY